MVRQEPTQNGGHMQNGGSHNGGVDIPDVGYVNDGYKSRQTMEEMEPEDKEKPKSTNKDEKDKPPPAVSVRELFRYATALDWLFMFIGTIAAIGNGVAQPVSFIFFGEIIDRFIQKDANEVIDIEEEMTKFGLFYVYIAIATIVLGYFQNMLWLLSSIRQVFKIRTGCFQSVLRQDIGWFDTTDSGEISTRMTDDITKIQTGIGDKIGSLVQAVSMLLGGFIIGFIYSWKLTLVIIACTPLILIAAFATGKVVGIITSEEQTSYAKAGAIAEEVLSSIRTVVAFGGEEKEIARYKVNLVDAEKSGVKKGVSTGFAFALFNSVIFGCCALGFWYGGTLVVDEEISAGDLLIVFFSVMIGAAQLGQVGPNVEAFAIARGSAFFIYQILSRVPPIDSMSDEGTKPKITGGIEFKECRFEYPSRKEVKILRGLNLSITPGTTVALVGESGCGKSTTIKLVQRFYDVSDGKVLIDGSDIRDINVRYLRKHIGVVSQEPVLFDTTIAENIKMGNSDATQEMIEEAAKGANAFKFISALPEGFNTFVGEGGTQLSGGQKQRIAIARALVRDPKILLLDEATSALDTESEAIVQAALDKASEGRTTIIIAHRLSTVRKANMIAVVANGQVVETGTHTELMAKRGEYFKLVMLQTFEEQEEGQEDDVTSTLSNEEREELLKQKFMRSISKISNKGGDDVEQIEEMLHDRLKRRRSTRKSLNKKESMKTVNRVLSKEKKEEAADAEPVNVPPIWRILKLNLTEWPYMIVGIICAAISGAMPVVFAVILSEVLESFTFTEQPQKMEHESEFWSIMFLALGCIIGVGYFIAQYSFAVAGEALTTRLREMAFRALLRQEIAYFDLPEHSTGALTARLAADASGVQGATSTRLNTLTQVIVMGVSSLVIAFIFSWQLTLVILAFVPLIGFAGAVQTKLNTSFAVDEQKKISEAGAIATESIMQIRTVASLGKEEFFYQKYVGLLIKPNQESRKSAHFFGLSFGFSMGILFFSNAASFRMGGYLSANHGLTLADMMKVIISIQFGSMTAGQVASFAPDYVKAKVAAGRILDLFDRKPPIDSYSTEGLKDQLNGDVEFKDVKFHYPNRPTVPVLQGLDISVRKGQMLALVGSSGCGKSTSVSLLERFYSITGGMLELDGKPIESFNVRHLRSEIGIVQQEPVLFDCSIRDNILYGIDTNKRNVTQAEIEEVCKNSNIHHFICDLPQGYDTNVGDKGALISGGQKQRIAIARALIRNPKILLLDEATSALDSESEKVVQEALDAAMEGRTSIVIAHRLSTIQQADVIAVIQGGKVVEIGSHQELLALKGAYHVLNQAQL